MENNNENNGDLNQTQNDLCDPVSNVNPNDAEDIERRRLDYETVSGFDSPVRTSPSLQPSKQICKFFLRGTCKFNDLCVNSHDLNDKPKMPECQFFKQGHCRFGSQCIYAHTSTPSAPCNSPNNDTKGQFTRNYHNNHQSSQNYRNTNNTDGRTYRHHYMRGNNNYTNKNSFQHQQQQQQQQEQFPDNTNIRILKKPTQARVDGRSFASVCENEKNPTIASSNSFYAPLDN